MEAMKRLIYMFAVWAVAAWIFMGATGCGPQKNAVVFAVGGAPAELAFWEKLVEDFERQSGIPIELLRQPTDTAQRRQGLVIALNARQSNPDVFLMDVAWLGLFIASDWLEPLGKAIDPDPFFGRILRLVDMQQGRLFALPVYVDGGVLYYRRDLLQRFGLTDPPSTWRELLSTARMIQNSMRVEHPRFYGFVWQGAQYEGLICNFMEFSGSNGGFVYQKGRIFIDRPENREALQFMQDLIWKHKVSPPNTYTEMKEEEVRTYFQSGNALFERNWLYAWSLHQHPDSPVSGKIGVAPLPAREPGERVSTLGGWHIGLSKFSDQKVGAIKFIQFVTAYETQKKLALGLGWKPSRMNLYADPDMLAQAPHFEKLKAVFETAQPRPILPYYPQLSAIIQKHVNRVLADKSTAVAALDAAQQEINRLQKRYRSR
jgi:multiple sugar transport system substrate-binding protein